MIVEVLFTNGMQDWKNGAKHLADGGIWFRQLIEDGKHKAHIYCLDKLVLAEFGDQFELTKFDRDIELYGFGYYLTSFRIIVWGTKLEQILDWRKAVQQDAEGSPSV